MIKLNKGAVPPILAANSDGWKQAILGKISRGETLSKADKSHYGHPEIKAALVQETYGKCAYCESKLRHISYGDVEHVAPKSAVPERWFDWTNLTLACDVCNTKKGDFYRDDNSLIDPYVDDPEQLLWVFGATILAAPGEDSAALTERVLELNRGELIERRAERLKGLMKQLDVIKRTNDSALRALLQTDFLEEGKGDREYAALARRVINVARAKDGSWQSSTAETQPNRQP